MLAGYPHLQVSPYLPLSLSSSRFYLPYTSPVSPLYLPNISPAAARAERQPPHQVRARVGVRTPNPHPNRDHNLTLTLALTLSLTSLGDEICGLPSLLYLAADGNRLGGTNPNLPQPELKPEP